MEKGKLDRPVGEGPEVRAADLKNTLFLQGQPVLQEMPAGAAAEGLEPCDASGKQISVQKFRRLRGQAAAVIEPCRGIDQPFRRLLSSGIRAVSGQQGGSAVQKPGGRLLPVGECGADLRQLRGQKASCLEFRPELCLPVPVPFPEIREQILQPCQDARRAQGLPVPVLLRAGKIQPLFRLCQDPVQVKALDPEILLRRRGKTDLQRSQCFLLPVGQYAALLLQLRDQAVVHSEKQERPDLGKAGAGDVSHRDPVREGRDLPHLHLRKPGLQNAAHVVSPELLVPEERLHLGQDPDSLRIDPLIFPDVFGIARFREARLPLFQRAFRAGLLHQTAETGADCAHRGFSVVKHRAEGLQQKDRPLTEGVQRLQIDPVQICREIFPGPGQFSVASDPAAFHIGCADGDHAVRIRDEAALQETQEAPGRIPVRHALQRCAEHLRQGVRGYRQAPVGIERDALTQEFVPELRLVVFKIRGDHRDLPVTVSLRLYQAEDLRGRCRGFFRRGLRSTD